MHETALTEPIKALFIVSYATLLFLAVFVLAAALRLADLSALPLSPEEAESVLVAWDFWHEPDAGGGDPHLVSPAYFATAAPFLALFGSGDRLAFADALVRFGPALASLLLIVVLWLARHELGILGSLTTAALIAVSPTAALAARTAGGDSWALLALVVVLLSALRFRLAGGLRWPAVAAVAFGFGLTTSPLFYTGVLALLLAVAAQRRFGPAFPGDDGRGLDWRRLALIAAASFVAVATFFLWRPAGLGGAATILGRWLAAFSLPADLAAVVNPLFVLGRYELGAVVLGAGALIWAIWRGFPLPQFFVYWYLATFVLMLVQPGTMANVLVLVLPAYLLIAQWLQHLFHERTGEAAGGVLLFVLLTGLVVYFNGIRFVRLMAGQQDIRSYVVLIALVIAFAAVTINLVRSWDARGAFQGTLLGLLLLFGFYSWGTAWWLTHEAANDPRAGLATVVTDDDVRLLATMLSEISYQGGFGPYDIPLLAAVDSPALRWYLRHFNDVRWGETVPPGTTTTAVITAATGAQPPIDGYSGLNLGTLRTGTTREGLPTVSSAGETLRWWLFRESPVRIVQDEIILWVRQDILPWNR
ncbi:MAG: hypothetical protein RRC07_14685 [Anaerolineae bacterium]|nr:hypothetical protein [Anaerolineae bacterium]